MARTFTRSTPWTARGCATWPRRGTAWSPDGTPYRLSCAYCFDKKAANPSEAGYGRSKPTAPMPRASSRIAARDTNLEDHRAGWSPDGKSLVIRADRYLGARPNGRRIFTIGTDGRGLLRSRRGRSTETTLTGRRMAPRSPSTPQRRPSPTQNIWTIHPDGSGLTQLTKYDQVGQATFHPTWSPDGTQILFSHSPSSPDGWGDFFVMNARWLRPARDREHCHAREPRRVGIAPDAVAVTAAWRAPRCPRP